MRRLIAPLFALGFVGLVGCASPCDRYCDRTADYIDYCLENGTDGAWTTAAAGGGWSIWGASDADEYAADCKEALSDQIANGDQTTLEGTCEDDANRYTEWTDRSACIDLP